MPNSLAIMFVIPNIVSRIINVMTNALASPAPSSSSRKTTRSAAPGFDGAGENSVSNALSNLKRERRSPARGQQVHGSVSMLTRADTLGTTVKSVPATERRSATPGTSHLAGVSRCQARCIRWQQGVATGSPSFRICPGAAHHHCATGTVAAGRELSGGCTTVSPLPRLVAAAAANIPRSCFPNALLPPS